MFDRQTDRAFLHKNKLNARLGFTLAEVLLTLAIIGVVASLTIPNLLVIVHDNQNSVAAKKAYSEFAAAWNSYINDNGGSPVGTFEYSSDLRNKFLIQYFSYIKVSSTGTNVRYFQYLRSTNYFQNNIGITTSSGVYIGVGNANKMCQLLGAAGACADLFIDVNGEKGPNRLGYDVFQVALMVDKIRPGYSEYASTDDVNTQCIQPGNTGWDVWTNAGGGCLTRILLNQPKWSG